MIAPNNSDHARGASQLKEDTMTTHSGWYQKIYDNSKQDNPNANTFSDILCDALIIELIMKESKRRYKILKSMIFNFKILIDSKNNRRTVEKILH